MKKIVFSFSLLIFVVSPSPAQMKQVDKKNNALTFGLHAPTGGFSDSHVIGIGADYCRVLFPSHKDSNDSKQFAFTINGGVRYFFGKSITVNSYGFEFGNFLDMHIMPGLIYYPFKRSAFQLLTGPAANLYKQNIRVGAGVSLFTSYYFTEKISAGPAIQFRKFSNTAVLWSAGVEVNYLFKN